MNLDTYKQICKIIEQEEAKVENAKRPSYTSGNDNVLHNFVRDGGMQGIDPMQNWLAHFLKQVAAVVSYVRHPEVPPSEPLLSRLVDIRVYAKLGMALAQDERSVLWDKNKSIETATLPEHSFIEAPDGFTSWSKDKRAAWWTNWYIRHGATTEMSRANFPGYMS